MCSAMAVPSCVMRSASHGGTRPPCSGRSAVPERCMIHYLPWRGESEITAMTVSLRLASSFALNCPSKDDAGACFLRVGRLTAGTKLLHGTSQKYL